MDRCFIFDIGNVLVNCNLPALLEHIAKDSGRPVAQPSARDLEMHHAVETGQISDRVYVDYLNQVRGLSWSVDALIVAWQNIFSINEMGCALFRDAVARGCPVYLLSNIADHHMVAIERSWPRFFDGVSGRFLSYQMGVRKPDPAIYQQLLEQLGVDGAQCLFIDDLLENVEAARTMGICAYRFLPESYAAVQDAVLDFF